MEPFTSADGSRSLRSARYGEPYRSHHGARSESWHVFVAGSGVAARLAAGQPTTVLELGLGSARNLATSAGVALAFGTSLHYVAFEHDVLPAAAWASQEPDALGPPAFRRALLAARAGWDVRPGSRCELTFGPVHVELRVGDATDLPWPEALDAIYLDGFSPAVNPELWSDTLLARVATGLRPGGTAVSYCVQGRVRRSLAAAGLRVEKRAGPPGGKREVLWARRPHVGGERFVAADERLTGRRLAVVGGGVAGASLALAAAEAAADVHLFDAADGMAGASGVPAALVNPYRGRSGRASLDDRRGAHATWCRAAALDAAGFAAGAHPTSVIRVADQARQARAWQEREGAIAFGPEAAPTAGRWRAPHGGLLVPSGGWIDPWRWLGALRSAATEVGASWRPHTRVSALEQTRAGAWRLLGPGLEGDTAGPFDLVALCLGASAPGALPHLPVTALPGAVALLPGHAPARPLAGALYAAPLGSPARYGLDPRRAWLAVGGGNPAVADDDGERLRRALQRSLPAELAPVQATWRGLRARGPDPQPQVAQLRPGVWWFGAFGGRGFLRAVLEAERLVARWARDER